LCFCWLFYKMLLIDV
jgi:hypothetical protein